MSRKYFIIFLIICLINILSVIGTIIFLLSAPRSLWYLIPFIISLLFYMISHILIEDFPIYKDKEN